MKYLKVVPKYELHKLFTSHSGRIPQVKLQRSIRRTQTLELTLGFHQSNLFPSIKMPKFTTLQFAVFYTGSARFVFLSLLQ